MNKYEICGKEYPIIGHFDVMSQGGVVASNVPLLDIPMMTDYQWQMNCLKRRIEHPEYYEATEDASVTIARLEKWLDEHKAIAKEKKRDGFIRGGNAERNKRKRG